MIGISYDNPEVTPEDKLRYDACITVPEKVETSGEFVFRTLKGGEFAVYRFIGKDIEIAQAYQDIFGDWLPDSGYQVDDRPCMEIYLNDPEKDPEHKFVMDICVPVKPL
jgi:AraC family transcriptional regulator